MANNRMWFQNLETGEKVLLAKYYPSTGWYLFHDDVALKLIRLFDKMPYDGSFEGKQVFRVLYDEEELKLAPHLKELMDKSAKLMDDILNGKE